MEKTNNNKNKNNQNKLTKIKILILVLIMLVIMIIISGVAYARYVSIVKSQATAQVANMICTMDVKSSSEDADGNVISPFDKTVVNPYCIITLKNYNGEESNPTSITQTDVSYTITVTPKKDANGADTFTMPDYYWYEITSPDAQSATKIATSTSLLSSMSSKGYFAHDAAETRYYKIVFKNYGTEDITRYVDFNLTATQVQPN